MKKDYLFVAQILRQPEQKEVKIEIPEWYEIDKENSTFEKIVFKKKDNRPRSWEEYCKNHKGDFYYISSDSKIVGLGYDPGRSPLDVDTGKNVLPNKELAEAFLAMMQLMSLRQAWIGNWQPDWSDQCLNKYCIVGVNCNFEVYTISKSRYALSFPTKEMATEFLGCFRDLLEQAKDLY